MTKKQRAEIARRLFSAGASVRAVLIETEVKQTEVAVLADLPVTRVGAVLKGRAVRQGARVAFDTYAAVAKLLGIPITDIPEAEPFLEMR